jgi:hypothetical protein
MTACLEFLQHYETDGGWKDSGLADEEDDCVVRAVAISLEIDYASAHRLFGAYGRLHGTKFDLYQWLLGDDYDDPYAPGFHVFEMVKHVSHMTVGEFIQEYPLGRFICIIEAHVFAVVNGVVHDRGSVIHPKVPLQTAWHPRDLILSYPYDVIEEYKDAQEEESQEIASEEDVPTRHAPSPGLYAMHQ